ncbi:MAG: very short patch repair endonuclease [Alphaproteobacteria bacterium]|nr:very short patch repair endonuclease [Alphaproteobacteria bacterium]
MPLTRSEQMSRIRGKNTQPELRLRRALWSAGLRYRLHHRTPAGRPDVVFPGRKVAVFIDGCFWHGCPLHYVRPGTREAFWAEKLKANVDRDRRQTLALEEAGWRVVRLWEHAVFEELEACVARVRLAVEGEDWAPEPAYRVVRVDVVDPGSRIERRILETLRDASQGREEMGPRVTAKWRRPKG